MTTFEHKPIINLEVRRCRDCGRYWALEQGRDGRCPCCAERRAAKQSEELAHMERAVASLRGALTKANKRNKRKT